VTQSRVTASCGPSKPDLRKQSHREDKAIKTQPSKILKLAVTAIAVVLMLGLEAAAFSALCLWASVHQEVKAAGAIRRVAQGEASPRPYQPGGRKRSLAVSNALWGGITSTLGVPLWGPSALACWPGVRTLRTGDRVYSEIGRSP